MGHLWEPRAGVGLQDAWAHLLSDSGPFSNCPVCDVATRRHPGTQRRLGPVPAFLAQPLVSCSRPGFPSGWMGSSRKWSFVPGHNCWAVGGSGHCRQCPPSPNWEDLPSGLERGAAHRGICPPHPISHNLSLLAPRAHWQAPQRPGTELLPKSVTCLATSSSRVIRGPRPGPVVNAGRREGGLGPSPTTGEGHLAPRAKGPGIQGTFPLDLPFLLVAFAGHFWLPASISSSLNGHDSLLLGG